MSDLTKAINNYMAVNNKNDITEREALEILKFYNDTKKNSESQYELKKN